MTKSRTDEFAVTIGRELKGAIVSHGHTASDIADTLGHSRSAMNRWLNGKRDLPLRVLYEVCTIIGASPDQVVRRAHERIGTPEADAEGDNPPLPTVTPVKLAGIRSPQRAPRRSPQ